MFNKELDKNNTKALSITELIIKALENGIDDFDVVSGMKLGNS